MDTKRLYVDFHVLQTVPPSCVNRDDTGSPKTAVYGGAVRARVSSQAWKHAMRVMFTEEMSDAADVFTLMPVEQCHIVAFIQCTDSCIVTAEHFRFRAELGLFGFIRFV